MLKNRFGQFITSYNTDKLLRRPHHFRDFESHIKRVLIQYIGDQVDGYIKRVLANKQNQPDKTSYSCIQLSSSKTDKDGFIVFNHNNNTTYTLNLPMINLHSIAMNIKADIYLNGKLVQEALISKLLKRGDTLQFKKKPNDKTSLVHIELIIKC